MSSKDTYELCSSILTTLGFGSETAASLIQKWRFFIEECEGGYAWDYSEYRNEIRVRWLIQHLLDNSELNNSLELKGFIDEVFSLDEKFKTLLQSETVAVKGEGWWDRGVLTRAGEEYCHYMESAHGISVEVAGL